MGSISINRLAARILGNYDHNRNGAIDLAKPKREIERRESMHFADRIEISTYTQRKLFEAADTNKDQQVTLDELKAAITPFDENGDGNLETRGWAWNPKKEYEKFDDAWGEDRTSVVHIPTGPPIPPIPLPPHRLGDA